MTVDGRDRYVMDNALPPEAQRLALLEEWADPFTVEQLGRSGLADGWRCLEVGAGAGSIAEWMCHRVAPSGRVVATDLDTGLLNRRTAGHLEVLRHDITRDPLPAAEFDLIHLRMVIEHLPDRQHVLRRLVTSLRPGGWLVVGAMDSTGVSANPDSGPSATFFDACSRELLGMLSRLGIDACYGSVLVAELCLAGVTPIVTERLAPIARGGSRLADFWRLTWESLADLIVDCGALSRSDVGRYLDLHRDGNLEWAPPALVTACARWPGPSAAQLQ